LIIPAALLEGCDLGEEIEMRLEGKSLVIEAVKAPCTGWFDGYLPNADEELWDRCAHGQQRPAFRLAQLIMYAHSTIFQSINEPERGVRSCCKMVKNIKNYY